MWNTGKLYFAEMYNFKCLYLKKKKNQANHQRLHFLKLLTLQNASKASKEEMKKTGWRH